MFISVSKLNDRYSFSVGDEPSDPKEAMFLSNNDFYLVDGLPSVYSSFAEAHGQAMWLAKYRPSCVLAKKISFYRMAREMPDMTLPPEDMIIQHYNDQLDLLEQRFSSLNSLSGKDWNEESDLIVKEMDAFISEMQKMIDLIEDDQNLKTIKRIIQEVSEEKSEIESKKDPISHKEACSKDKVSPLAMATIWSFSTKAAAALQYIHERSFVKEASYLPDREAYEVSLSCDENGKTSDLVSLMFNKDFLLEDIIPSADLQCSSPYHSRAFYERYWEPIINAVGHIYVPESEAVIVTSLPSEDRFIASGFHISTCKPVHLKVSTSLEGKFGSWWIQNIKTADASKFKQEDLVEGVEVVCTRPDLKTYYERTGTIVERREQRDFVDLVVDFRRGIGEVVLTDKDVEIVPLPL